MMNICGFDVIPIFSCKNSDRPHESFDFSFTILGKTYTWYYGNSAWCCCRNSEMPESIKLDITNFSNYLSKIISTYGTKTLDYCVWYNKECPLQECYNSFLSHYVCDFVISENFMGNNNYIALEVDN